jgi:hypothetical protein
VALFSLQTPQPSLGVAGHIVFEAVLIGWRAGSVSPVFP